MYFSVDVETMSICYSRLKEIAFLGGVSSAWTFVVVFWFVPLNPSLITLDYLGKKF
jgi:hypothetical protein